MFKSERSRPVRETRPILAMKPGQVRIVAWQYGFGESDTIVHLAAIARETAPSARNAIEELRDTMHADPQKRTFSRLRAQARVVHDRQTGKLAVNGVAVPGAAGSEEELTLSVNNELARQEAVRAGMDKSAPALEVHQNATRILERIKFADRLQKTLVSPKKDAMLQALIDSASIDMLIEPEKIIAH